jgi:hypothetical protein
LCEFQYLNLKKTHIKIEKWSLVEDEYLVNILK